MGVPQLWTKIRSETGMTDNAYMLLHYSTLPVKQLQNILKRNSATIHQQAKKLGIVRRPPLLIADEILALASRPQGFRAEDIKPINHSAKAVWNAAKRLTEAGKLTRIEISYKHVRYFTDPKLANIARIRQQPTVKGVTIRDHRSKNGWGPDDPATITKDTKYTYGKSPGVSYRTNTHGEHG
jgi:hypothetical protein